MKTWNGKKALITGGTSGLGQALASELMERGAKVSVVARDLKGQFKSHHPHLQIIRGDVSDKNQIHRIYAEVLSHLGSIDLLVNNASSLGTTPLRLLSDTDCEEMSQVIETNLMGPFRLTKLALGSMILQKSGFVVNISSDAAVNAYPRWGSYSISKAALDHLTRIFQTELSGTGVQFLALDPGDMDTPLHLAAVPDADRTQLFQPLDSAKLILNLLEAEKFTPLRRNIR